MFNKSISGGQNGKFDKVSINNTTTKIPIEINGKAMSLENLLPKQKIVGGRFSRGIRRK